jgi:hypothetical protein
MSILLYPSSDQIFLYCLYFHILPNVLVLNFIHSCLFPVLIFNRNFTSTAFNLHKSLALCPSFAAPDDKNFQVLHTIT